MPELGPRCSPLLALTKSPLNSCELRRLAGRLGRWGGLRDQPSTASSCPVLAHSFHLCTILGGAKPPAKLPNGSRSAGNRGSRRKSPLQRDQPEE
jgi:hypothetical protein